MPCTAHTFPLQPCTGRVNHFRCASQLLPAPSQLQLHCTAPNEPREGRPDSDPGLNPAELGKQPIHSLLKSSAQDSPQGTPDLRTLPALPASCSKRSLRTLRGLLEPQAAWIRPHKALKDCPAASLALPSFGQQNEPRMLACPVLPVHLQVQWVRQVG